mmetsp:Transcript_43220/g.101340  ORF Transcript_43220/g.101340 Transcript_43220/m.101340 type:complete len:223 (+) Transcript_43220:194-862(+)
MPPKKTGGVPGSQVEHTHSNSHQFLAQYENTPEPTPTTSYSIFPDVPLPTSPGSIPSYLTQSRSLSPNSGSDSSPTRKKKSLFCSRRKKKKETSPAVDVSSASVAESGSPDTQTPIDLNNGIFHELPSPPLSWRNDHISTNKSALLSDQTHREFDVPVEKKGKQTISVQSTRLEEKVEEISPSHSTIPLVKHEHDKKCHWHSSCGADPQCVAICRYEPTNTS